MSTATATKVKKDEVLGCTEPRIWTKPLDSHVNPLTGELLAEFTDGPAAIAFANDILQIELYPWQEWFLNHALELDETGTLYRFRIVICMVARQNGKTTVENVLALWHMYALESGLVIGTAQSLDRSEEAWKDCLALAELDDELDEMIEERNFGHPKYFNLDNGCEYRVSAATRKGARGFSGDLILLDELREHTNFDSWASVTNTMNARPFAQAFAFSNAGDATGVVLRYQRALAHKELGWPDGDDDAELLGGDSDAFAGIDDADLPEGWDELTTGFFEWSAAPNAKRTDVWALAQANPAMNRPDGRGMKRVTLRNLLGSLRSTPAAEFEIEVLCRFVPGLEGGPFPVGSWDATADAEATPGDDAEIVVCVEVSHMRDQSFISRAGRYVNELGKDVAVVGISADEAGTDWIVKHLVDTRDTYKGIVVRSENGAPTVNVLEDLKNATDDNGDPVQLPIIEWDGSDIQAAHADITDRLAQKTIEHLPHKGADIAANSAIQALVPGGGWRIDIRKSPTDTAALTAMIGAVWGMDHLPEQVSIYATRGVRVIQRRGF